MKGTIMWKSSCDQQLWETPSVSEMRFGFEVTMYVANR